MKDSRILSSFLDLQSGRSRTGPAELPEPARMRPYVFDTCQPGVVLRAVVFVQAIVLVASLFETSGWMAWLLHAATLTGAALPGLLVWLLSVCLLKRLLDRLPHRAQWLVSLSLGIVAGLYGCGLLAWIGLVSPAPWVASAASGALLAAMLTWSLFWRARARMPASAAARLAELQARIRPHFLFNTLNSAIALVRDEPAKAERLLEDLSELFRHALADAKEAVTLRQELDLARHYLAIEQIRFGERLRIEWNIDDTASRAKLPPLILQPLVENAIKHGVEPSPSGATVRISTKRRGDMVVIKVTNTVPAGTGAKGNGLALDNVRQRLSLLHDLEGRFQSALVNGVFQARLEIPF
ncbi:sensor histidine kinase [Hydrogenophaga bisanensis]|uniref:Sensor histidine kinase n=1 Tax=Hydrogenophaga bisanensis TaxID=439611 RepID=A0ABW2R5B5_9BURK|nr:histidine kinase [Hydrogenophaga sp.]